MLVGAGLFFIVRPIVVKIPLLGGIVSPIAFVVGLLGMVAGGYLLARSTLGPGA